MIKLRLSEIGFAREAFQGFFKGFQELLRKLGVPSGSASLESIVTPDLYSVRFSRATPTCKKSEAIFEQRKKKGERSGKCTKKQGNG